MFSLKLSRPFQNLCAAHNINARSAYTLSTQSSTLKRSPSFEHALKRASGHQVQARSASTTPFWNASFASNGGQAKRKFWGTSGLGLAGLGLGFAASQIQQPTILCEGPPSSPANAPPHAEPTPTHMQPDDALPPPPRSSLNPYELGFGTVAGICAGVFIKKGAKLLAFALGGIFVLLQYLASMRLVRVNWTQAESRFEDTFYSRTTDAAGHEVRRAPTVYSLWRWIINFLAADFPPRATFIAGMALGLRLG